MSKRGAVFAIRLIASPVIIVSTGFALSIMWRWFVVPLGLPVIGIWHAVGVASLVGFVTMKARDYDDTTNDVGEAIEMMCKRQVFVWLLVLLLWPVWGLMP